MQFSGKKFSTWHVIPAQEVKLTWSPFVGHLLHSPFGILFSKILTFQDAPGTTTNAHVHTYIRLGTYTYVHVYICTEKRNEPGELLRSPRNSWNLCNFVSKSGKYFVTIRCLCFDGIRGIKAGEISDGKTHRGRLPVTEFPPQRSASCAICTTYHALLFHVNIQIY